MGSTVPRLSDRLFFAIYPDAVSAARIARLAQTLRVKHGLNGNPFKTERFHVTLHLGDFPGIPQDVVAMSAKAAAAVKMAPFDIEFDRASSFGGRRGGRPFVLCGTDGIAEVTLLHAELGALLAITGVEGRLERQYTPHLTLLYDDRNVAPQTVESIHWTVREFVLVHSLLGRTQHTPLGRWQLHG